MPERRSRVHHACIFKPMERDASSSGVLKGNRTYVDAENIRNNRDCGLRLLLASGGFNVGVGIKRLAVYEPV